MSTTLVRMTLCALSFFAFQAHAQVIEFDHLNLAPSTAYRVELADGEKFTVRIRNTDPDSFEYRIEGFTPLPIPAGGSSQGTLRQEDLKTVDVAQVHDGEYGGYYVRIRPRTSDLPEVQVAGGNKRLQEATLTIIVTTVGWDYELAGAFAITTLTNPVFAVVTESNGAGGTQQRLVQDFNAEDEANLGLAAMVHLYHHKWPKAAVSFGVGMNEGNDTSYFFGPSWRFSDKAAITVGYAWGPRQRLPAGVRVGDIVTDANLLNDLPTRTDRQTFISFSYSFLNPGNALQKPFAGGTAGSTPTPASPPAQPPAQPANPPASPPANGPAPAPANSADSDNDGILDGAPDNCPDEANNNQLDADSDGVGDVCEDDD